MSAKSITDDQKREVLDAMARFETMTLAAGALGMPRNTFLHRYNIAKADPPQKPFDAPALPDELPSADELLKRRKSQFGRKSAAKEARQLIPITVNVDGPFGIMHMGDPHVDDDGTDIALLERHVAICNKTPGLFAANVGDYSNNWVGRLARLYGEQSVSAQESWVLVEWLITSTNWLYLIGGNHDLWSGASDPVKWMARQANSLYEHHGARLGLKCPNGREIRVNARHDFKGHSQWNTAHGPSKAAQMGWRDHILACGHTHVSGYQVVKDPATGLISHALRVASYKTHDRYADEKGLPNQNIFVAPVTIIDPRYADTDPRCITVIFDPEEGADFLTFKRKRKAA
jgi:hypothetical protein